MFSLIIKLNNVFKKEKEEMNKVELVCYCESVSFDANRTSTGITVSLRNEWTVTDGFIINLLLGGRLRHPEKERSHIYNIYI